MMPPFVVFPTNRIAHFVEVSLYLFYLAQQVKLRISNQYLEKLQQKLKIRRKKLPRTNKKYRQEKNQVI